MKPIYTILVICLTLVSCVSKDIEYQKLDNIKILQLSSKQITLSADAFFKNPNILGGKVTPENILVYINDKEVTEVKANEFKVPAAKEFSIPLEVAIPFNKLPNANKNGSILSLVMNNINKTHKVTFKGNLNYRVAGFKSTYKINHTEELKLEL